MEYQKIDINSIDSTFSLIGKDWMLISATKDNKVNTMTASWGNLGVLWNKNVATIYIRPQRYTKEFVDHNDQFTLTFFDGHKKELGVLGSKSGRDGDKINEVEFNIDYIDNQPTFKEGKLVLVCKKLYSDTIKPEHFIDETLDEKMYPQKDHHTFYIAEIISAYKIIK